MEILSTGVLFRSIGLKKRDGAYLLFFNSYLMIDSLLHFPKYYYVDDHYRYEQTKAITLQKTL